MKDVYFYIDESGKLANDDKRFFILCCYITDKPGILTADMNSLYDEICNQGYYDIDKFKEQGFHACDNHPDIRADVYKKLYTMDLRLYMLIVDKESKAFIDLKDRIGESNLYGFFTSQLLKDRMISERHNKINLIFEEYGSYSIEHHEKNMQAIVERLCKSNHLNVNYSIEVRDKTEILLSIVDYCAYIIFQILHDKKTGKGTDISNRWVRNFALIEPKLAYVNVFGRNLRYSSTNIINFTEILDQEEENK